LRDVCKCAFSAEDAIWRTFWKFCGKIIHRLKFKSTKFEEIPIINIYGLPYISNRRSSFYSHLWSAIHLYSAIVICRYVTFSFHFLHSDLKTDWSAGSVKSSEQRIHQTWTPYIFICGGISRIMCMRTILKQLVNCGNRHLQICDIFISFSTYRWPKKTEPLSMLINPT
jgi:hypothetical protein